MPRNCLSMREPFHRLPRERVEFLSDGHHPERTSLREQVGGQGFHAAWPNRKVAKQLADDSRASVDADTSLKA